MRKYGKHILVKDKRDSHPSSKVIGCLCVCIYMSVCVYLCVCVATYCSLVKKLCICLDTLFVKLYSISYLVEM